MQSVIYSIILMFFAGVLLGMGITKRYYEKKKERFNEQLNSVDFHDLLSNYRIAPMEDQERVIRHFENIKEWLKKINF